jgi:hypothetical protein
MTGSGRSHSFTACVQRLNVHRSIAKIYAQFTVDYHECFIGVFMMVPDEISFDLHYLELVVINLGDYLGSPVLLERTEFLVQIY